MAIYLFTGRPRHGKTFELARRFIKKIKNGERIYSNLKFNLGIGALKKYSDDIVGDWSKKVDRDNPKKQIFYWSNIHEWEHFNTGNILVDEAQRYFNARQWDQLSPETEIKLQQHGKDDLNIYGTTQHYRRIDISLRELVEMWFDVETVFGSPNNKKIFFGFKLFKITAIEGIEFFEPYIQQKINPESKIKIPKYSRFHLFHKKIGRIYDTRAKVGRSEAMPLIHSVRKCLECGKEMISHS